MENKEELSGVIDPEVAVGWSIPTEHPPTIPFGIRPMAVVPKLKVVDGCVGITGWRLVVDASHLRKGHEMAMAVGADGETRFVAPNLNFDDSMPWVDYCALSEIARGGEALLELAKNLGLEVVGQCYDFAKCFR